MIKQLFISPVLIAMATAQPNIIFILTDDMSWTGTSVQIDQQTIESKSDFYQTPNIAMLAAHGMSFSAAYAPGPLCSPSRAGILTGKTPAELHMTTPGGGRPQDNQKLLSPDFIRDLPSSEDTIGELLRRKGYATAHLGKWHLGRGNPGQHGFDVHDGSTSNNGPGDYEDPNPKDIFELTHRAAVFMEKQAKTGKPFYLQLSHYAVHLPVQALKASEARFGNIQKGERHSSVEYAAMTWDLDTSIGMLLEKIDELKLTDNTYVVFMSDNGAPGNPRVSQNLPLAGGKGTLYEGGIRVPLIVRGPGISAGTFCREAVTGCDLLPTFCEWADAPPPEEIEGTSIAPLLKGMPQSFKRSDSALLFHFPHYGKGPNQKPQSAIIVGNYKLLKHWDDGTLELFNLDTDLSEEADLSHQMPEKTDQLNKLLESRLEAVKAQVPTENPNYRKSATPMRTNRK